MKHRDMTESKGAVAARLARVELESYLRSRGIDPAGPMQLEIWGEDWRTNPNDYGRSALFTVRNKRMPRAVLQNVEVFHLDRSVSMTYTGIELRADDDLVVWEQIIHYARLVKLGDPVNFNLHQLLVDLDWGRSRHYYRKARECISRLKANEVRLVNTRIGRGVGLSLIDKYAFEGDDENSGTRYTVWIHPHIMALYAGQNYTYIPWLQYRKLSPVARRLFDYVGSHKQPYPLSLEAFRQMCGSECQAAYKWAQTAKGACTELQEAGLVKSAWVDKGRVVVER